MDKITEITKVNEQIKEIQAAGKREAAKKVCIMGFAPSWPQAPFKDDSFEIWTLNEAYKLLDPAGIPRTRINRWFEIHNRNSPSKATPEHINFLQTCNIPVYMQEHYDDIPSSVPFPFKETVTWLKDKGHIGYRYFTNSISWMIGLAIMEGFQEIWVVGVDMAQDEATNGTSEYAYQKPSCEYMLGVAEKYAKVWVPDDCDLLYCENLYGLESDNNNNVWLKKQIEQVKLRRKKTSQQLQQASNVVTQSQLAMAHLDGAESAFKLVLKKRL
jgi:hypothetical protein